jgi:hypothetical protein
MKNIEWINTTPSRTLALMGDTQVACIDNVGGHYHVNVYAPAQDDSGFFATEEKARDFIVEQLSTWITEAEEWIKIVK